MKTAVSIPTPLFEAAERQAKKRGISRSQLYAEALEKLLEKERGAEITAQLNAFFENYHPTPEEAAEDEASIEFVREAARRTFERANLEDGGW